MRIAFGIFAHNEAQDLPRLLDDIRAQDILSDREIFFELHLLANGCTDDTVEIAREHPLAAQLGACFFIHDLAEGGKSRTWNRFVHDFAPECDILGFLDADIRLPDPDHLSGLTHALAARPELLAFVSRPVADAAGATTPVARAILRGGGGSDDWRRAICGQCYLLWAEAALEIHLPIGLPVEDGFLRAMLLTNCMERRENPTKIDGDPSCAHLFEPERSLSGFLKHQERIVVGSAVNSALFAALRDMPAGERCRALSAAAAEPGWISARLRERLPDRRCGWVPWHFLFKRSVRMIGAARSPRALLGLLRLPAYFLLDLIVFLRAQMRLAKGIGTDFW
ncbi:glycosyltransferase [Tropicimonas sp. TH_r6]|uniref:glycosyltransferase n=1 Tax=Tropicimonas sp. TH_r6 TaxID=3082085 RepID=UPI0029546F6A|nr:glycosyltransferase [Tropicimonas sp. TH_r6]MDV7141184.1 glycosyltransferase [Tropicimonas sp. TH_r6]